MSHSEKIRQLREAIENANPELAADAATRRFERQAIPVPAELLPPADAPKWQRRAYADAAVLFRELVVAEPDGLTLTLLLHHGGLGQKRHQEALKLLRKSGTVTEGRRGADGFDIDRIFLRAVSS